MSLNFNPKEVLREVIAFFRPNYLPNAKKPYVLKPLNNTVLDVHEVASKALTYNISTDPAIIEEGAKAYISLVKHLLADGYGIKNDIIDLHLRIPGEYEGAETHLPAGVAPEVACRISRAFQKAIAEQTHILIKGIDNTTGEIGEVIDTVSDTINETITPGTILTIRGHGLKVDSDADHASEVGVFFVGVTGEVKSPQIGINTPKNIDALVPTTLVPGMPYKIIIRTQLALGGGGTMLKNIREVKSRESYNVAGGTTGPTQPHGPSGE